MNGRLIIPFVLAILAIVGVFASKNFSASNRSQQPGTVSQTTQSSEVPQAVTSQNADAVLTQTDTEINQNMSILDQDLSNIDAAQSQQENPDSL